MNRRAVWAIARKDLVAVRTNMQVWMPMTLLPVILGAVMPGVLMLTLRLQPAPQGWEMAAKLARTQVWLSRYPPAIKELFLAMPDINAQVAWVIANYMLAPVILVLPLMAANVMATESFVGERERGTLEALLLTPVTLAELFAGKVLASLTAALATAWLTFLLQVLVVNAIAIPWVGRYFFPQWHFAPLMLLVVPAVALAATLAGVFISARVKTFQAAYQLGGLLIIPVVAIIAGQAAGLLLLDSQLAIVLGLAILALDLWLLRVLGRRLDRDKLATTWL